MKMPYDASDVDFRTNRRRQVLDFTITEIAHNRKSSVKAIDKGANTSGIILQKIKINGSGGREK